MPMQEGDDYVQGETSFENMQTENVNAIEAQPLSPQPPVVVMSMI